jgi:hypothetical protein
MDENLHDMEINQLRELNRQLKQLLDDPHPGLLTWNTCVYDVVDKMSAVVK